MKKNLLTITFSAITFLAIAQQTLLSSEMLPVGASFTNKSVLDLTVIDTTIKGAGVTWDFTTLTNNTANPDLISTRVSVASTPYASSFPNSNYAFKEENGTTTNYRYFNLTSTKLERVGSRTTSLTTYSDPQIEYIFPLVLGATNSDTWASSASSFGGNYDLTCIGAGTLKLPMGNFDALMVRANINDGGVIAFPAYFWYSADNGTILLTYIEGDGGFYVGKSGNYTNSIANVATDIEKTFAPAAISAYPNPSNGEITFHSTNAGNYSVINELGEFVQQFSLNNNNQNTMKIENLGNGIYFIVGNGMQQKIVVIK
jgi:Secretion system C-terminal sorting domain